MAQNKESVEVLEGPLALRIEELQGKLAALEQIYVLVYGLAQAADLHAVFNFAGWMHEYLELCRASLAEGVDFIANEPRMNFHHAIYTGEKLRSIFGQQLCKDSQLLASFLVGLFGGDSEKPIDQELTQQVWEAVCRFVVAAQARQAAHIASGDSTAKKSSP